MAAAVTVKRAWSTRVEGAEGVCGAQTHNCADDTFMAFKRLDCVSAASLCFPLCLPLSLKDVENKVILLCLSLKCETASEYEPFLFLNSALVGVYSRQTGVTKRANRGLGNMGVTSGQRTH